jgi:hypothetical protein
VTIEYQIWHKNKCFYQISASFLFLFLNYLSIGAFRAVKGVINEAFGDRKSETSETVMIDKYLNTFQRVETCVCIWLTLKETMNLHFFDGCPPGFTPFNLKNVLVQGVKKSWVKMDVRQFSNFLIFKSSNWLISASFTVGLPSKYFFHGA